MIHKITLLAVLGMLAAPAAHANFWDAAKTLASGSMMAGAMSIGKL